MARLFLVHAHPDDEAISTGGVMMKAKADGHRVVLAAGSWTGPLAVTGRDEISELGRAFNQMAERLREVDRLKEEFFSHISHDLRNPLAAIRLSAEALQERARAAGDAKQARYATVIDSSAARPTQPSARR